MTKNPFYNALAAILYIFLVSGVFWIIEMATPEGSGDSPIFPVGALSLLVLSVATMALVFFYQPVSLLLEGKRPEAFKLLASTIAIFAGFTALALTVVLSTMAM